MKKNKIVIFLLLVTMLISTGCGESVLEKTDTNVESGEVDEESLTDGIYILTKDGKYYKPDTSGQSFDGIANAVAKERYIYNVEGKVIPTLGKDDKLIIISSSTISEGVSAERFKSYGWTIGIVGLSKSTTGKYTFDKGSLLSGKDAENQLTNTISDTTILYTLDGEKKFDVTQTGFIYGLKKNKTYSVELYQGTIYNQLELKADTKMWVSNSLLTLDKLSYTKKGYAIVNTDELENGYYNFNGTGLIRVKR